MEIKSIIRGDNLVSTRISGKITIELSVEEIGIVSNALYELSKDKQAGCLKTLYHEMSVARDVLTYGHVDGFTFDRMAEYKGYSKPKVF